MSYKRAWEAGASVLLLVAVTVVGYGIWRRHSLNQALAAAIFREDVRQIRARLAQGADVNTPVQSSGWD